MGCLRIFLQAGHSNPLCASLSFATMSAMEQVEEDSGGVGVGDGDEKLAMSSAVFCTISRVVSFHCPTSRISFVMDSSEESTFVDGDGEDEDDHDAAGDDDAPGDEDAAAVQGDEDAEGVGLVEDDIVEQTVKR
jgi:hypothetical protein